jgi:dehydrogenase/reductase SDR family protein 13
VLFTKELARRLEGSGVTTYAVHPGQVATDAWRRIPQPFRALFVRAMRMIPPSEGARSTLNAATSPELADQTGRYYDAKGREKAPNHLADDVELARQLWTRSAEWTGVPS